MAQALLEAMSDTGLAAAAGSVPIVGSGRPRGGPRDVRVLTRSRGAADLRHVVPHPRIEAPRC